MTNKRRIGLSIPMHLYEKIKDYADYNGQTINATVIQILLGSEFVKYQKERQEDKT